MGKRKKLVTKKLAVIFTSGSEAFLKKLNAVLKKRLALKQKRIYKGKRAYQLRYGTSDSVKTFSFLYKDALPHAYFTRKTKPFLRYFMLHPSRKDQNIEGVIKTLRGHVVK